MKIDANMPPTPLGPVPKIAREAEGLGFDGLWASETQHAPFLPLALAAEHTERMNLGTAVAIGFARNPATLAYVAWDLAEASKGRFIMGLGTQVKGHIERRFGMPWPESPVGKLRELILAMRALWNTWQTGEKLNFRGEYFKLTLMSPFFNPGSIEHPEIPIYIAGVNTGLCRLAGEVADGFHVHPYHSAEYISQVVRPAIAEGAARVERDPGEISIAVPVFVATDEGEKEFVRSQIAFYASTPTYRPVMAFHGWGQVADELQGLARKGGWGDMPAIISDEMLETFAVVAPQEELGAAVRERYTGLADRITFYLPFVPGTRDAFWRMIVEELGERA